MNSFIKILLYIFFIFIILNLILFLFLLSKSYKKSIKDKIYISLRTMEMGYTLIYTAFIHLISGKKLYKLSSY